MILNSDSVKLIRANAERLANSVQSKDALSFLASAQSFEAVFESIEMILTNTDMYFDDEMLTLLDETNFQSFKAVLLVYTFNLINRKLNANRPQGAYYAANQSDLSSAL
jgi:hypothetical protein